MVSCYLQCKDKAACFCFFSFSFSYSFFLNKYFFSFNWITQLPQKKEWAKTITKFEYCHRVTECGHQPAVILVKLMQRRSATLPVATYPVSCFPQSVVMRVIPLCEAVRAQSRDPALRIFWNWIKGDSRCLRKTLNVSRKNVYNSTINARLLRNDFSPTWWNLMGQTTVVI